MSLAVSQQFANWGAGLKFHEIPDEVVSIARRAIFDTIGVIAAGQVHSAVKALNKTFGEQSGPCQAIGSNTTLSAATAAMINGCAAHAWDFDDTSYTGIMHGSAVILPAVLAVAQETGATEEDFIAAFIVGSEIAYTLAEICGHDHYFAGWWSTTTFGLTGATAAAAHLYKLSPLQYACAIGMSAAAAGGGKSVFGSDGKPILVGDAARRGVEFAKITAADVSGPLDGFEDPRGFFTLLNNNEANLQEVETLGKRWRLLDPGLLFKTSPICSAAHAAIDQLNQLMKSSSATPENIKTIEAQVPELVFISLVYNEPETPQQAQFSLPYALACSLLHGQVRLEDLGQKEVTSPEKKLLMEKISVVKSDELSSEKLRRQSPECAKIIVQLADGSTLDGFCGQAYGMPLRPLTDKSLLEKINTCLRFNGAPEYGEILKAGKLLDFIQHVFQSNRDNFKEVTTNRIRH